MRIYSTLTAIAMLFTSTVHAFDAKSVNFEQQATEYTALNNKYSPFSINQTDILSLNQRKETLTEEKLPRYLTTYEEKNWDYLIGQTATIFGLSVATVGLMTFLPETITKWDEEDRDISNLGSKWWDNVSSGPIWDEDEHYLNYIMHPYFGGVYYTAARHSGFNQFESFLYSAVMSTFFWEYGVEAFAEVPSIQDIIVTPLFGALVGEMMYAKEQDIIAKGEVFGSKTLADVSLFFLNPVGKIHYWLTDWWDMDSTLTLTQNPWFGNTEARKFAYKSGLDKPGEFIGFQLNIEF